MVIGDGLGGEWCPAIDAAAACFLRQDAEGTRGLLIFFTRFPAPQEREILQKETGLITADTAAQ